MASTFRLKRKLFAGYKDRSGKLINAADNIGKIDKKSSVFALDSTFNKDGSVKAAKGTVTTGGSIHGGSDKAFESTASYKKYKPNAAQKRKDLQNFKNQSQADKLKIADTIKANKNSLLQQQQSRQLAMSKGYNKGLSNAGIGRGTVNTWGRMGTVGKVGTAAAVVGTGYLAGKGLGLWGNSDKK